MSRRINVEERCVKEVVIRHKDKLRLTTRIFYEGKPSDPPPISGLSLSDAVPSK
jgi:hypothetical protein